MTNKTSDGEWFEKSIPPGTFQPIAPMAPPPEAPVQTPPVSETPQQGS